MTQIQPGHAAVVHPQGSLLQGAVAPAARCGMTRHQECVSVKSSEGLDRTVVLVTRDICLDF